MFLVTKEWTIFGKTWCPLLQTQGLKHLAIEPRRLPPSLANTQYLPIAFVKPKIADYEGFIHLTS